VQNVLVSFRLSDGRHTLRIVPFPVSETLALVQNEICFRAEAKRQSIEWPDSGSLPEVQGDALAVLGILYNLVDNAIKFSPHGGRIAVSAGIRGDCLELCVHDSGPGISDADRSRLFGRFERLSARPTADESSIGLGLYVARELALMNGGDLVCLRDSPVDHGLNGARFLLFLRLANQGKPAL
jgi:signal transduction histidine kinase